MNRRGKYSVRNLRYGPRTRLVRGIEKENVRDMTKKEVLYFMKLITWINLATITIDSYRKCCKVTANKWSSVHARKVVPPAHTPICQQIIFQWSSIYYLHPLLSIIYLVTTWREVKDAQTRLRACEQAKIGCKFPAHPLNLRRTLRFRWKNS